MGYYRTAVNSYARGRPLAQMGYRPRKPRGGGGYKKPKTGAPVRQGQRVRRAGKTATYTRRKRKTNRAVKQGDNSSFSYTFIKSRWNPKLKSLYRLVQGKQTRLEQSASSAVSTTGTQNALAIMYFAKSRLDDITTICNDGNFTDNSVRCFIGGIKLNCSFKNQSNAVGKLMIYDLICKKHTPSTNLDTPTEAWSKGYTDLGAGSLNNIGTTPNISSEFRQFWGVHKVTTVMLEPGQQHDHVVSRSINKVYDSTYWANNVGTAVARLTGSVMFVWHGSLAHESSAPTNVTYTEMRLDFAHSIEYTFGYMKQNVPSHTVYTQFPSVLADPDFMGEAGDVDANVISA